jgi:hypothetical protein
MPGSGVGAVLTYRQVRFDQRPLLVESCGAACAILEVDLFESFGVIWCRARSRRPVRPAVTVQDSERAVRKPRIGCRLRLRLAAGRRDAAAGRVAERAGPSPRALLGWAQ